MTGFTEHNTGGVCWLTADILRSKHGFLTRLGGVSTGTFSGMNFSASCGDDPVSVRENYRLMGQALGIDPFRMVYTRQVHGTTVRTASLEDIHTLFTPVKYEADGLVCDIPGLPILAMTADCVPVLMEDTEAGVVSAVHCGWRGTVLDILGVAVGKMVALGAKTGNIRAAIGPAIGSCCFETGPEVPEAIAGLLGDSSPFCVPEEGVPGRLMVDLRAVCRERLLRLGVPGGSVAVSAECTKCRPDKYWSHRATKGVRGIQANIIVL